MENLISVIINFHNGEKYLENSLKSVLEQNYKNLEIILWDNASTDDSKKVVNKFNDIRIRYFRNSKKDELYKARNKAISESKGTFIAFLDCDDWWEKDYLSSRKKFFKNKYFDFFIQIQTFFGKKKKKIIQKFPLFR